MYALIKTRLKRPWMAKIYLIIPEGVSLIEGIVPFLKGITGPNWSLDDMSAYSYLRPFFLPTVIFLFNSFSHLFYIK